MSKLTEAELAERIELERARTRWALGIDENGQDIDREAADE